MHRPERCGKGCASPLCGKLWFLVPRKKKFHHMYTFLQSDFCINSAIKLLTNLTNTFDQQNCEISVSFAC